MSAREFLRSCLPAARAEKVYVERPPLAPEALRRALALGDDDPTWRAVHQVIDEMERETITTARDLIAQTDLCKAAVSAGETLDLLRRKLRGLREEGIKGQG